MEKLEPTGGRNLERLGRCAWLQTLIPIIRSVGVLVSEYFCERACVRTSVYTSAPRFLPE